MRHSITLCLAFGFLLSCVSEARSQENPIVRSEARDTLLSISQLNWMSGYWSNEAGNALSEEFWTEPAGNVMVGIHRDIFSSGKSFFEFLRIQQIGDTLIYWASPGGKPATPFRLATMGERKAVFEKLDHDFPQRIIYQLETDGTLTAIAEGIIKGQKRSEKWNWRKK